MSFWREHAHRHDAALERRLVLGRRQGEHVHGRPGRARPGPHDFDPIPVWLFLDYAEWFQEKVGIELVPNLVARDSESLMGTSRRRSREAGALSSPTPSSPRRA